MGSFEQHRELCKIKNTTEEDIFCRREYYRDAFVPQGAKTKPNQTKNFLSPPKGGKVLKKCRSLIRYGEENFIKKDFFFFLWSSEHLTFHVKKLLSKITLQSQAAEYQIGIYKHCVSRIGTAEE